MIVDASLIRNDLVFTSDNKKIGSVINVILTCSSRFPKASILVFPPEQNWLEGYVKKHWGKLTIGTIKRAFPAEIPKIAEDIKTKGAEEAERIWNAYSKDNLAKAQLELKKCYLIPSLAINGAKRTKKEVFLKIDLERVESRYGYIGEPPVSAATHVAFFSASNIAFRDAEKLLPATLNLQPIQGLEVQDCNGDTGIINDIQVDFERNEVVNLIVQTSGEKAANRIVRAEDLDLSTLTCNKEFGSCAELPFA